MPSAPELSAKTPVYLKPVPRPSREERPKKLDINKAVTANIKSAPLEREDIEDLWDNLPV